MRHFPIKRFGLSIGYLLSIHVLALLFFFVFRFILFVNTDYSFPESIALNRLLQSIAFVRGLWFDNVIACYILIIPLVFFWIAGWFSYTAKWLYRFANIFFCVFYAIAFSISAANIPYFGYFFKIINSSIFNWFGYAGTTTEMIVGETTYYFPIALGILSIIAFSYIGTWLSQKFYTLSSQTEHSISIQTITTTFFLGAVLIGLCIFGIRGRRGYNPIKVSQAYYCNDPFLNQIGVNPVFNLLTSYIDDNRKENRALTLMNDEKAINKVQELLNRGGIEGLSPIARNVMAESGPSRKNVVMILMESMSAHLMSAYGNTGNLTPFLDSLYKESLTFKNFYSSGIHTNHGMYSTLYSFPAIMKRNAMKGSVIPIYSGLPTVLKANGYHNSFFMTHESQYDNMNAFFRTNGFDDIYAQENYPSEKVVNGFGVQDDFLFEFALQKLNEQALSDQPFFSVLLTISNHPPYIIPPFFKSTRERIEEQIVEYADWSIRQFMTKAAQQPWFENTIFVLLGDHGKLVGTPECESPQSYNHIPLMIYGKDIKPDNIDKFCGQIDLAPTLLSLLNISYTQNNFGINLFEEERPCMFFTADNLVGARDSSCIYIYIPDSQQELRYKITDIGLTVAEDNIKFQTLKEYCFSMLQCAEYMVSNHLTVDSKGK